MIKITLPDGKTIQAGWMPRWSKREFLRRLQDLQRYSVRTSPLDPLEHLRCAYAWSRLADRYLQYYKRDYSLRLIVLDECECGRRYAPNTRTHCPFCVDHRGLQHVAYRIVGTNHGWTSSRYVTPQTTWTPEGTLGLRHPEICRLMDRKRGISDWLVASGLAARPYGKLGIAHSLRHVDSKDGDPATAIPLSASYARKPRDPHRLIRVTYYDHPNTAGIRGEIHVWPEDRRVRQYKLPLPPKNATTSGMASIRLERGKIAWAVPERSLQQSVDISGRFAAGKAYDLHCRFLGWVLLAHTGNWWYIHSPRLYASPNNVIAQVFAQLGGMA